MPLSGDELGGNLVLHIAIASIMMRKNIYPALVLFEQSNFIG
jgi:hypothetical protein